MPTLINDCKNIGNREVEAQAFGHRAKCRVYGNKIRCEVVDGTTWGKNKSGMSDEITVGPNEMGYCEASHTNVRCCKVRGVDLIS